MAAYPENFCARLVTILPLGLPLLALDLGYGYHNETLTFWVFHNPFLTLTWVDKSGHLDITGALRTGHMTSVFAQI